MPVDDFQARAAFSASVEKVYVAIGDKVSAGQLLIRLKDPFAPSRYTSAEAALQGAQVGDQNLRDNGSREDRINFAADLARAQIEQKDAEASLATLKRLQASGATSEAEVAAAERRVQLAATALESIQKRSTGRYSQAELKSSSARLTDAAASLNTARQVLANANITSTIAGTVYSLPVTASDFVNMGSELMRIADLSRMQIKAFFDEPDIGQLAVGQPVDISWSARPTRKWHGHIQQVPLTVFGMGSRMVGECVIRVDDADGTLLPHTDVVVNVTTHKLLHVLTIPREALHVQGDDRFVFRVVADKLVRTPVDVGLLNPITAQVTRGLGAQDVVALASTTGRPLAESLAVRTAK